MTGMARLKLGLTGTIGSGKSTALSLLSRQGWHTVRTDDIAREEMERPAVVAELRGRWGEGVFHEDGVIDRRAIGRIVFADPGELDWLESVLHPLVRDRWTKILEEDDVNDVAVEIPLLFEKKLANAFDKVVSVDCPETLQAERLQKRGLSAGDIEARKRRQWSAAEKNARADFVLSNCGTIPFLEKQIIRMSGRLRGAANPPS